MKIECDSPLSPAAPLPPRWNFGYYYLLVCLVSGCWGIILNQVYARKPPNFEELPLPDVLADAVSIAALVLAIPILHFAYREKRPWRYMIMAGFELVQFGLLQAARIAFLLPALHKHMDPSSIPMPPALFWVAFALSIVEALVAVGLLSLPTAPPPPPLEPDGQEP